MSASGYSQVQSERGVAADAASELSEATRDPLLNLRVEETAREDARKRWCATLGVAGLALLITVVIVVAVEAGRKKHHSGGNTPVSDFEHALLSAITAGSIEFYADAVVHTAHPAGSQGDLTVTDEVASLLRGVGYAVDVMGNDGDLWNQTHASLELLRPDLSVEWTASLAEKAYPQDPDTDTAYRRWPILAYSASATAQAPLVYVNYATQQDFSLLVQHGHSLQGKVGIARYGSNFRGTKCQLAGEFGLAGLIIYSDPADDGYVRGPVYPDGPWRPSSSYQRGTVINSLGCPGNPDPTRIFHECHLNYSALRSPVPALPLSWSEAYVLLSRLGGTPATGAFAPFQGGLNFTYHVGAANMTVRLRVEGELVEREIHNLVVQIPPEDPSTLATVILGSHRDAWVYGASDPISSHSAVLSIAAALREISEDGWAPKRRVVVASWDGEEYNLIGSTQFTEFADYASEVANAVAYVNLDAVVAGSYFVAGAFPMFTSLLESAAAGVLQPNNQAGQNVSLLDYWLAQGGGTATQVPGSGSDFVAFQHHRGIPSLGLGFVGEDGSYHSVYDDSVRMSSVLDPGYELHRAAAQVAGLMVYRLASEEVLPFNLTELAQFVRGSAEWLVDSLFGASELCSLAQHWQDSLQSAVEQFAEAAEHVEMNVSE